MPPAPPLSDYASTQEYVSRRDQSEPRVEEPNTPSYEASGQSGQPEPEENPGFDDSSSLEVESDFDHGNSGRSLTKDICTKSS